MFLRRLLRTGVMLLVLALPSQAGATSACAWHLKNFDQSAQGDSLDGVAATAANDVWVVGKRGNNPLIRHWNGTSWLPVADPAEGYVLNGVAARTASDAWAVGVAVGYLGDEHAVAVHFDGSMWTSSSLPPMDGYTTVLNGAAYAGTGLWAVGGAYPTGDYSAEVTYAVYYGKRWQYFATPNVPGHANVLYAVSASSPTNVWAVGQTSSRSGQFSPLVEHWNGKWHIVPTPLIKNGETELTSVYALSNTDVWVAGRYAVSPSPYFQPLFEHWNGKAWSIIMGPAVKGGQISGLAGSASNDIVAAGYVGTTSLLFPLSEHWDGTKWSIVPTPQVSGDYFSAVAHVPNSPEYWAAGALYPEGLKTVTALYDCSANEVEERRGRRALTSV